MSRPVLILVNGIPATGKTTISRKLAKDLDLPCLGKDDVKEMLFEHINVPTPKYSNDVGAASTYMHYAFIRTMLQRGHSIIAESAYYRQYAFDELKQIIDELDVRCVEVYCQADNTVRDQRYKDRFARGERHPGHFDKYYIDHNTETPNEIASKYAPLDICPVITIDTTEFTDEAYKDMLEAVRNAIQYEGNAAKGEPHAQTS